MIWLFVQDAICELSEHGMVITVEEWTCLQARVYFRKEVLPTCFPRSFFICETLTLNPKPLTAWGCWSSTAFQRISISSRCAASIWGQLGSIDWLLAYIYFFYWHHCPGALLSRPWHAVASQVRLSTPLVFFQDFVIFAFLNFIPVSYANCARCSKTAHSQFLHF